MMHTGKENLRQTLKAQRLTLSPSEVAAKSQIIAQKLIKLINWTTIDNMHIYVSKTDWNEVDTAGIIQTIHDCWPHIAVDSPSFAKNTPVPTRQYDLIIVPAVGFDTDKYRLGLGRGWYDRFLAGQAHARTIGLAYSFAIIGNLPRESHDKALDTIITDL